MTASHSIPNSQKPIGNGKSQPRIGSSDPYGTHSSEHAHIFGGHSASELLDKLTDKLASRPALTLGLAGGLAALGAAAVTKAIAAGDEPAASSAGHRLVDIVQRTAASLSGAAEHAVDRSAETAGSIKDELAAKGEYFEKLARDLKDSVNEMRLEAEKIGVQRVRELSAKVKERPVVATLAFAATALAVYTLYNKSRSETRTSGNSARDWVGRPYEDLSREELYLAARECNIEGRSTMSREELIRALKESR